MRFPTQINSLGGQCHQYKLQREYVMHLLSERIYAGGKLGRNES